MEIALRAPAAAVAAGSALFTAHHSEFAGQAQFAEEFVTEQRLRLDLAACGEDAQRDGQVVAAAGLGQVGRDQVQDDATLREVEARAEQNGTPALASAKPSIRLKPNLILVDLGNWPLGSAKVDPICR